jgi:hypothetical protein
MKPAYLLMQMVFSRSDGTAIASDRNRPPPTELIPMAISLEPLQQQVISGANVRAVR